MLYSPCLTKMALLPQIEDHCLLKATLGGHVQKISCKVDKWLLVPW